MTQRDESNIAEAFRRCTSNPALDAINGKEMLNRLGIDHRDWLRLVDGLLTAWLDGFLRKTDSSERFGALVDLFSAGFVAGMEYGWLEQEGAGIR